MHNKAMQEQDTLKAIYQITRDLERETAALKEFKADLKDQLSELDSYDEFIEAKQKLAALKKQLKRETETNSNLLMTIENVEKVSADVRDLKDILSLHLTRHYADTGGEVVPVEGEPGVSQPIIVSAKLGGKIMSDKGR